MDWRRNARLFHQQGRKSERKTGLNKLHVLFDWPAVD